MHTKRAYLSAVGKLDLMETDIFPQADEVLVKVAVCGLCSWEINHFEGRKGPPPMTLGHEWAGTVVEAGTDVQNLSVGDHVAFFPADGGAKTEGFSEYVCAKEKYCFRVDASVDLKYAVAEPLKCIVTVLRAAKPEPGDYCVVIGCGPMGLSCIQGLGGKMLSSLVAIDMDEKKLQLARKCGATHTINPTKCDAEMLLSTITKGHLADFAIECTGSAAVLFDAQKYLKRGNGRLVMLSSYHDAVPFNVKTFNGRGAQLISGMPSSSQNPADDMRRAVAMLENGSFSMQQLVTHEFKLGEIQKAFESLRDKPEGYVKGIVVPG